MESSKKKVVFLDRDGTINEDVPYLADEKKFKFLPGVVKGLRILKDKGFLVFVISNQSGVGRGYIPLENLKKIHKTMEEEMKANDVTVDGVFYCPHLPEDKCDCRKPETKLFRRAIEGIDTDIKNSYVIGDKISDMEAGKSLGCKTILVLTGEGEDSRKKVEAGLVKLDLIADNFMEAVNWIVNK